MGFYAGLSWCLKGVWRCYCRLVFRFRLKETKGRFSCIAQVPGVGWEGKITTFCFLPLLRTYSMSCTVPDLEELAPQNFVSASDTILVYFLPCSLGSSHTNPLSKCQACFNLRTYFFFLKCFPKISVGWFLLIFQKPVTLQSQCHLLKEMGNLSWSHPRHSLWASFFIFIFHYLKYPFSCQVYLFFLLFFLVWDIRSPHKLALPVLSSSVFLVLRPHSTHSRCSRNEWMTCITLGLCMRELWVM